MNVNSNAWHDFFIDKQINLSLMEQVYNSFILSQYFRPDRPHVHCLLNCSGFVQLLERDIKFWIDNSLADSVSILAYKIKYVNTKCESRSSFRVIKSSPKFENTVTNIFDDINVRAFQFAFQAMNLTESYPVQAKRSLKKIVCGMFSLFVSDINLCFRID